MYRVKLGTEHGSVAISMKPSRGRTKTVTTVHISSPSAPLTRTGRKIENGSLNQSESASRAAPKRRCKNEATAVQGVALRLPLPPFVALAGSRRLTRLEFSVRHDAMLAVRTPVFE